MASNEPIVHPRTAILNNWKTDTEHTMDVTNKQFIIGRALNCDLVIHELYISRVHCSISYNDGEFIIFDHESRAGTFVNCNKVTDTDNPMTLNDGDIIAFGEIIKNYTYDYVYIFNIIFGVGTEVNYVDSSRIQSLIINAYYETIGLTKSASKFSVRQANRGSTLDFNY